jgi:hypothetical protein
MKTTMTQGLTLGFLFSLFLVLGCETSDVSRKKRGSASINPSAYSGDWMYYNTPTDSRPKNEYEFYFKKCSVDHREPFPVGGIWSCTPPE